MAYIESERNSAEPCHRGSGETGHTWLGALADVVPFALLIGAIMGSIYAGWATPTEAASGGCLFSLMLCLIWGDMTWRNFVRAMQRTVQVCGNLMFIIYAAYISTLMPSVWPVSEKASQAGWSDYGVPSAVFPEPCSFCTNVLGCLVEKYRHDRHYGATALYPVLGHYGIDPIWFGVILVMYVELGQISPPIGINLFVIQSIWDGELGEVVMGTIPFHIIMFVLLFLLTAFPQLALWLPSQMN